MIVGAPDSVKFQSLSTNHILDPISYIQYPKKNLIASHVSIVDVGYGTLLCEQNLSLENVPSEKQTLWRRAELTAQRQFDNTR